MKQIFRIDISNRIVVTAATLLLLIFPLVLLISNSFDPINRDIYFPCLFYLTLLIYFCIFTLIYPIKGIHYFFFISWTSFNLLFLDFCDIEKFATAKTALLIFEIIVSVLLFLLFVFYQITFIKTQKRKRNEMTNDKEIKANKGTNFSRLLNSVSLVFLLIAFIYYIANS